MTRPQTMIPSPRIKKSRRRASKLSSYLRFEALENRIAPAVSIDYMLAPSHIREGTWAAFASSASTTETNSQLRFDWDFGDGALASGMNMTSPGHRYNSPGIYVAILKVTDSANNSAEAIGAVTVQDFDALFVNITPAAQTVTINSVVTLDGSFIDPHGTVSTEDIEWDWDYNGLHFTPDTLGSLQVTHTFDTLGLHHVALRVTDNHDVNQIREAVVFVQNYQGPDVNAGSDISLFEGQTVQFNGSYTDPDGTVSPSGIAWDFDWDGEFNADVTGPLRPTRQFIEPGLYNVALRVTDNHDVSGIGFLTVEVKHLPPYVSAGVDREVAAGDEISFVGFYTMAGTVFTSDIQWDFDYDGINFDPNPSATGSLTPDFVYTQPGSYQAALRVTDQNNVTVIDSVGLSVSSTRPVVTINPEQTITQGQTANFSATIDSMTGVTVDWDFDYDGTFAADPSAHNQLSTSHQYLEAGVHHAAIQAVKGDGAATIRTVRLTVNNTAPSAVVTYTPAAEGTAVHFDVANLTDVNSNADFDFLVDWTGAGEFERVPDNRRYIDSDGSSNFWRVFDDNGTYPVTVRILDYEGGYTDYPLGVSVTNAVPVGTLMSNPYNNGLGLNAPIRFLGVSDASHADSIAGFTYFHRVTAELNGNQLYQTEWLSSSTPKFYLPDYRRGATYTVDGFISDKDGGVSYTSTATYGVRQFSFGVSFLNEGSGSVLVNGQLFEPGAHTGVNSPSTLSGDLTVTLLESGEHYGLITNSSFASVAPAPGVTAVSMSLVTTGVWSFFEPLGDGNVGDIIVPSGDSTFGPSIVSVYARGTLGTITGPGGVHAQGAIGNYLHSNGLLGSIIGLDTIYSLDANFDGNSLGWLGDSPDDRVLVNRGITQLRAYGVRAGVLADSFFNTSDNDLQANIGPGGVQEKMQVDATSSLQVRGSMSLFHTNYVNLFQQWSPTVIQDLYIGNTNLGTDIWGTDGSEVTQLAMGSGALERAAVDTLKLTVLLTTDDFKKNFWDTIEDGKLPDWEVHHTLPQGGQERKILVDRFRTELGIDINSAPYLRGVSKETHYELNGLWNRWRIEEMKRMGLNNPNSAQQNEQFFRTVDLERVKNKAAELEPGFKDRWLEPHASPETRRARFIQFDGAQNKARNKLGEGERLAKAFPELAVSLGVFSVIGGSLTMAYKVGGHDADAAHAWALLEEKYTTELRATLNGVEMKQENADKLRERFIQYLQEIDTPDEIVQPIDKALKIYINTQLRPF